MSVYFRVFTTAGKRSAGVFLIPQSSLDVGTAIDELLLIWLASEASEWGLPLLILRLNAAVVRLARVIQDNLPPARCPLEQQSENAARLAARFLRTVEMKMPDNRSIVRAQRMNLDV